MVVAREERQHPRRRVALAAHVATLDAARDAKGVPYYVVTAGRTLDVGDGGLGLEVDSRIEAGRRVLVEVTLADGRTIERVARIAWTSSDGTSTYVGIRFDEPMPGLAHST